MKDGEAGMQEIEMRDGKVGIAEIGKLEVKGVRKVAPSTTCGIRNTCWIGWR